MPHLYVGKAVSNNDCDALVSHARNRLQSDREDRCQESRRQFPFVADGEPGRGLPLRLTAGPEEKPRRGCLPTPTLKKCHSDPLSRSAAVPSMTAAVVPCTP